ncbi:hypothetical protein PIB30_064616 [Stylosanthes scabra]|uniref:Protein FAR1-RELATED SEQUENCE n=1 Tax=Stylosanthes scabra TaxID=79078 RepID=A0ABU6SMZ0_9FABA|nr:hypothetical protein [Stylosanthes scabra]
MCHSGGYSQVQDSMDITPESPNSQDNIEDCVMNGAKENVSCTCDCGGSSSKCAYVTADDIRNQTFETSDTSYNLYVSYARYVGFGVRKGDAARRKDGSHCRRQFFFAIGNERDMRNSSQILIGKGSIKLLLELVVKPCFRYTLTLNLQFGG